MHKLPAVQAATMALPSPHTHHRCPTAHHPLAAAHIHHLLPVVSRRCVCPPSCATNQPSTSGKDAPTAGAWSQRLLNVAKKRKEKLKGPSADIFTPVQRQQGLLSVYEGADEDEEGSGLDDFGRTRPKRLPAEMRCFDTARIFLQSGNGGNGCVAFRREKFVEFGGPAGGSGGRGGNVWAIADPQHNSLSSFRKQVHTSQQSLPPRILRSQLTTGVMPTHVCVCRCVVVWLNRFTGGHRVGCRAQVTIATEPTHLTCTYLCHLARS